VRQVGLSSTKSPGIYQISAEVFKSWGKQNKLKILRRIFGGRGEKREKIT
jgi:hypothetical protein